MEGVLDKWYHIEKVCKNIPKKKGEKVEDVTTAKSLW